MAESLAVQANKQQNMDESKPENTRFPGHDSFQNGVIENGKPTTFYTAATNKDIENIKDKKSNMSGFVTDGDTVNSCKNENGVLDANALADKTQTQPWRPPQALSGDYTYRENVAAFDVRWDELNKPENADLKARLCDSDGNLKCAFGKAEENYQWGNGGGSQYYFNKDDFNEAVNRGVFEYKEDKSFLESKGELVRSGVSEKDMGKMNDARRENINESLQSCPDKNATTSEEKAKSLNQMTPEKESKINSDVAPKGNYIASPDTAYNYGQKVSSSNNSESLPNANSTAKIAEGGGSHAPPASNNETETTKKGKKEQEPVQNNGEEAVNIKKYGHKPDPTENNEQHKEPVKRGKKEQDPVQNNDNEAVNTQKRGFTPSNENGDAIKTVNPASEQSSKVAEEASKQAAEQAGRETAKTAALGV